MTGCDTVVLLVCYPEQRMIFWRSLLLSTSMSWHRRGLVSAAPEHQTLHVPCNRVQHPCSQLPPSLHAFQKDVPTASPLLPSHLGPQPRDMSTKKDMRRPDLGDAAAKLDRSRADVSCQLYPISSPQPRRTTQTLLVSLNPAFVDAGHVPIKTPGAMSSTLPMAAVSSLGTMLGERILTVHRSSPGTSEPSYLNAQLISL